MGRVRRPKNSVFRDILEQQYDEYAKYRLYRSVKGSKEWVQKLDLWKALPIHSGCVNCICWNEKGDRLLSGSDDQHLVITQAHNYKVLTNYKTSHKANIFSAKFLPCTHDTGIVSCSGDGMILYSDLLRLNETHYNVFNCHIGTTYEVATIPNDPYTFLSCGEDYTVRSFDLRTKERCLKQRCMDVCNEDVIISCHRAVTALTVNTTCPFQLAIGCSDSTVRIYDRRMLTPSAGDMAKPLMTYIAPGMEGRSYRITSLSYSPKGEDILVSYSSEHLYLFGVQNGNTTTMSTRESPALSYVMVDESPIAPVRRLRLRGDWSDTGPDARPQNYAPPVDLQETKSNQSPGNHKPPQPQTSRGIRHSEGGASQARPTLHGTLMQRMTDVLSRMLNDPATRAALSHGGEGAFPESDQSSHSEPPVHDNISQDVPNNVDYENAYLVGLEFEEDEDIDDTLFDDSIFSDTIEVLSWMPLLRGSEGEEGEEEATSGEVVDPAAAPDPLDLPLPSFSASFTQSNQSQAHQETMDVDQVASHSESEEEQKKQDVVEPSTSTSPPRPTSTSLSDTPSTSSSSSSPPTSRLPHLNELSTAYQGFVEKTGSEPMVNLMYSDVGSTASCIVIVGGEPVSREPQSNPPEQTTSQSPGPSQTTPPKESKSSSQQESIGKPASKAPEPSQTGEDEFDGLLYLDEDLSSARRPVCRRSNPSEKNMDVSLRHGHREINHEETITRTRKSYFKQKYVGHRNARTMIKEATFWGEDYVISGSDCGHVLMWERDSGKLQMLLQADHHVVNCVQPHPYLPLLATSGIDYDVKLWAPIKAEPFFDEEMAEEVQINVTDLSFKPILDRQIGGSQKFNKCSFDTTLEFSLSWHLNKADQLMKRNAVMLEETKDTITVPASFMIRMLACLNQIRRGGRGRPPRRDSSTNSD